MSFVSTEQALASTAEAMDQAMASAADSSFAPTEPAVASADVDAAVWL